MARNVDAAGSEAAEEAHSAAQRRGRTILSPAGSRILFG
jgi:hypothetical protein